jgi:hypothetical protein
VACIWHPHSGQVRITVNKRHSNTKNEWTHHAEALMAARMRREVWDYGGTLYVIRFKRDGSLGCARPCPLCDKKLRKSGADHVYYTNDQGLVERLW